MLQSEVVNILDFKLASKAHRLAQKLLNEATKNEPLITEHLKAIAKSINAEIVGLESKLKSTKSLERKLKNESIKRKIPIERIAKRNNDALRYTFIFAEKEYAEGLIKVISALEKYGYEIPRRRIWNAWDLADLETDSGYRGINTTIISSQKQKFELQFHTKESFWLKTETHVLYEELRLPQTSAERTIEILRIILPLAAQIQRPRGI